MACTSTRDKQSPGVEHCVNYSPTTVHCNAVAQCKTGMSPSLLAMERKFAGWAEEMTESGGNGKAAQSFTLPGGSYAGIQSPQYMNAKTRQVVSDRIPHYTCGSNTRSHMQRMAKCGAESDSRILHSQSSKNVCLQSLPKQQPDHVMQSASGSEMRRNVSNETLTQFYYSNNLPLHQMATDGNESSSTLSSCSSVSPSRSADDHIHVKMSHQSSLGLRGVQDSNMAPSNSVAKICEPSTSESQLVNPGKICCALLLFNYNYDNY